MSFWADLEDFGEFLSRPTLSLFATSREPFGYDGHWVIVLRDAYSLAWAIVAGLPPHCYDTDGGGAEQVHVEDDHD